VNLAEMREDPHEDEPNTDEECNDEEKSLPVRNVGRPQEAPVTTIRLWNIKSLER
jgi:hypothetical protein